MMTTAVLAFLVLAADPTPIAESDPSRQSIREAITLYGWGVVQQRHDRLLDATRLLEESLKLDPDAVPPRKLLISLYHALGRSDEAIKTAAAVVVIDPSQTDTWRHLARMLHELNRTADGISVLTKCVTVPQVIAQPMDLVDVYRDLGGLYISLKMSPQASEALTKALRIFGAYPHAALAKFGEAATVQLETGILAEALTKANLAAGYFTPARDAALEAQEAYRQAHATDRLTALTPALAAAYAGLGETAKANELLDDYLSAPRRDLNAYTLKARLVRQAGDRASELAMLTKAVEAQPDFVELRVFLGDECRAAGQRQEAIQAYRSALDHQADVAAYRGLFGIYSGPGGSPAEMLKLLDAVSARTGNRKGQSPSDHARAIAEALRLETAAAGLLITVAATEIRGPIRQTTTGSQRTFETWWILGCAAEKSNQLGSAETLLRAALGIANAEQQFKTASALMRVLEATSKLEAIVALCQSQLAGNSALPDFYHDQLARVLLRLGRVDEALAHADKAVALAAKSRTVSLRLRRVEHLRFAERLESAQSECRALLKDKLPPEDERKARLALSKVCTAMGQAERAEEQLRQLLELDPADAIAHNELGYLLAESGQNLDEAERLLRRALELDRMRKSDSLEGRDYSASSIDGLGLVYLRRGRVAEAKSILEHAAKLPRGARDPSVWDHLGDACARLDQPDEAVAAWQRACDLSRSEKRSINDPRGAEIERKLKRIKNKT